MKRPPPGEGDDLPVDVRNAVTATLEPGERIERHVPVVGADLLMTSRRLIVVRHGYGFRPATGIRSWRFDSRLVLRIEPGLLRIEVPGTVTTVLYHAPQQVAIRSLVAAASRRGGGRW